MNKCEYCLHHRKRDGMIYCKFNNNYPPQRLINAMGCSDFKELYINLLEIEKEEEDGEKN